MKETIPVTIFGQSFLLRSTASAEEVQRVAAFVNQAIADVEATDRVADSLHVALLAFLNVAQAHLQLQEARQGDQQESVDRLGRLLQTIDKELEPVLHK